MKLLVSPRGWLIVGALFVTLVALVIPLIVKNDARSKGAEGATTHLASDETAIPSPEGQVAPAGAHLVSVNRDWGFVRVEGIDALDLSETSELEVIRDGLVLANIRVAVIEGTSAVADILPGSHQDSRRIRAGDVVQ